MARGLLEPVRELPRRHPAAFCLGALALQAALACLVAWLVSTSGTYPGGGDAYAHLFAARSVLDGIRSGNPWPAMEPLWYNGAQLTRVTEPLVTLALAACEAVGGDVLLGFVAFCGLVYLLGALGWLHVGKRLGRPWLCLALGALWFLLPANLCALFQEGDLPRSLCLALLPALFGKLDAFLEEGGRARLAGLAALSAALVLSEAGFAVLVGMGVLLYVACFGLVRRSWARGAKALLAVAAGAAACGVWLVPFVRAGGLSDVSQAASQGLLATLAPQGWLAGSSAGLYLGLAAAALIAFGLVCGRRESRPAFLTAAAAALLTAQVVQPVVGALTCVSRAGSLGLVSVALACALLALARWRSLRRPLLACALALLAIDAAPSWQLLYGNHSGASAQERLERDVDSTLVSQAREVTRQRLALVDEAGLDAESAFLATGLEEPVAIAEGANGRAAVAKNYEQLDRALEEGRFGYLFDRSLELGCDSVIVRTSLVSRQGADVTGRMDSAAGQSGYVLVAESGEYRLYHHDAEGSFGVRSSYEAIAIGTGSGQIALQFPSVEETTSASLDDYTLEELSAYRLVILDGFTYSDREAAEGLVRDLAARGTRVVVMADGIPSEERTGTTSFLGVSCQPITFHGGFPELSTSVGTLACDLFPSGHELWQTVFLNGLDEVRGSIDEEGRTLPFYGTVCDGNVTFVGLNLTYFEAVTGDAGVAALLADSLGLDPAELPGRELVPLEVSVGARQVSVTSPADDVDVTLAWQDSFAGTAGAAEKNGLLRVDEGTFVLSLGDAPSVAGIAVSVAGLAVLAVLLGALARAKDAAEVH